MATPRCRKATPSAFQNAVTASTLPAASSGTAEKPIVTRFTAATSPPSPATTARSTATSEGSPVTPTPSGRVGGQGAAPPDPPPQPAAKAIKDAIRGRARRTGSEGKRVAPD